MNVFYEEDGTLKAAAVLADQNTSFQIETPHGKRGKIKASHVLIRFASPSPSDLLAQASDEAGAIPLEFLWEASGEAEFGFDELACEYFGAAPKPHQMAAIALRLHSAPMYFYRKGRGRYKAAPADALKAALAGQARREAQAAQVRDWQDQLLAGQLPDAFRPHVAHLSHQPDKASLEWKALDAAAAEAGVSAVRLLQRCGAIPSTAQHHFDGFLLQFFPQGRGHPDTPPALPDALPEAGVAAFSIDDASTTEIDDAFSVSEDEGLLRFGIHIAAPALGLPRDSEIDRFAAERMSTVYLPGDKITMLPAGWVDAYTLAEHRCAPAVSLYIWCDPSDYSIRRSETRVESVAIAVNLRLDALDPVFNQATVDRDDAPDFPWRKELLHVYRLALALESRRGKQANTQPDKVDYSFSISDDASQADGRRVDIRPRRRGSPLDTLVSELMILANSEWGRQLDEAGYAAIYRSQSFGKTRMSTQAAPHQGLGVSHYAWSSSPLRRYSDLVNQRQIIAWATGEPPVYGAREDALFALVRDFELAYDAYADFQRHMERYWCLRYLIQEGIRELEATLIRDDLVRLNDLPLVMRARGLPLLEPGASLRLTVDDIDLLDVTCRLTPANGP